MSKVKARLTQEANIIAGGPNLRRQDPAQVPWNPDNEAFPKLADIPRISYAPQDAAWFWGKDDNLGRINLLTSARVKAAAIEIKLGETIPLNLPVDEPNPPAFHRRPFEHSIKPLGPTAFDDEYSANTQSSTQWDGFRHVGHPSGLFYNGLTADIIQSTSAKDDTDTHPGGIHHIAHHGISARAILLDYHTWSQTTQASCIDPFSRDSISLDSLVACGKYQGLNMTPSSSGGDIQPGDILLIRIGFTAKFRSTSISDWSRFAKRDNREQFWAGLDGSSEELRTWIHDCYFSAVASDVPALESWPPVDMNKCLHTSMIPLWGCIIGEFFDLERLSERCRQEQRWKVFFVSSPPNVKGGVGAWANAIAIL